MIVWTVGVIPPGRPTLIPSRLQRRGYCCVTVDRALWLPLLAGDALTPLCPVKDVGTDDFPVKEADLLQALYSVACPQCLEAVYIDFFGLHKGPSSLPGAALVAVSGPREPRERSDGLLLPGH